MTIQEVAKALKEDSTRQFRRKGWMEDRFRAGIDPECSAIVSIFWSNGVFCQRGLSIYDLSESDWEEVCP